MCDSSNILQHDYDSLRSLRRIVHEETEGGRRIVRSLLAIAEGNANNCTPWHQIEATKLLLKIGNDQNQPNGSSSPQSKRQQASTPAQPADINTPSPLMGEEPDPSEGRGWDGGEESSISSPSHSSMSAHTNPEHIKANQRLVARIRLASHDGATIIRVLMDILDGYDPDAKTKDKIQAAKLLYHWGFSNPHQPTPEQMLTLAPCHPDCLCACKDMPEDHPEVTKAHKPLTPEQKRQRAEEQAKEEERERRTAELIERKMRNERQRKLEEFHSPEAKDDRRIEREELRKRRKRRKEQKAAHELERKRKRVEAISRETALELDLARDEELAGVRARQPEPGIAARPEPVLSDAEGHADERTRRTHNSILNTHDSPDCYYEPLSPEDQALFDYQVRLESGEFKEGDFTGSVRDELVEPPIEDARKEYAAALKRIRQAAASEGVPVLPNPLAGTLHNPTARSP